MSEFKTCKDELGEYLLYSKNLDETAVDFSFIVGAYNASLSITESIYSLLNQDYKSFEIIIVDDGSTDNTFELLYSFFKGVNNVLIIKQENIGLTSSLNRCIDVANGKYIARHDADDISYPNRLSVLKKYFDEGESFLMSFADVGPVDSITKQAPRGLYFRKNYVIPESLIFGNPFVHGTFAFTKQFISKYKYNDSFKLAQDFELLLRTLINDEKIRLVPYSLYKFIQSNQSVSYKRAAEQIKLANEALILNGYRSDLLIAEKKKFKQLMIKAYREFYLWLKG